MLFLAFRTNSTAGPRRAPALSCYLSAEEEDEMPELREGLAQRVGEVFGRCGNCFQFDQSSVDDCHPGYWNGAVG